MSSSDSFTNLEATNLRFVSVKQIFVNLFLCTVNENNNIQFRSVKRFVKPSDEHIIRIEMSNFTNYDLTPLHLKNSFPNQQFIRNKNIFRSSRLKPRRWQIYPSVHGSAPIGVKSITTCIQELSAIWKLIVISILMIMST